MEDVRGRVFSSLSAFVLRFGVEGKNLGEGGSDSNRLR